jgi:hypothetical protein
MKGATAGFWGTTHWALDLVGRGTVWALIRNSSQCDDSAYAIAGGALTGGSFGAVVGFLLSVPAHDLTNTIVAATLGCLLGVCTGISFGALVEIVDTWIKDIFNSLNSQ